tara:strand:- start:847 stop:1161 length:315 start_codon:yes stop_codon:yes gene_type:complete
MANPHDLRLTGKAVASGTAFLWPEDGSPLLKSGRLAAVKEHRLDIVATGSGVASIKYRSYEGQTLRVVTPPTDWTTVETLLQSGVYQFELTATTDVVTFDIESS